MKLVLFIHQAAELYGSDKVLLYLVTGLAQRDVVKPVVVLPGRGPLWDALQAAGIEVHVAPVGKITRAAFNPVGLVRLLRQVLQSTAEIDRVVAGRPIIAVHSNTLAVLAGAVWAHRRRVPHLWHVHEIIQRPRMAGRVFPALVRWLADTVVSNSTLTQQWLLSHQPALAGRAQVVFNGLPDQPLAPATAVASFRAQVGAQADTVLIVLAGRLNHSKGQGLLIEAVAILRQRGSLGRARLAIVGDAAPGQAHWAGTLAAQANAAGLADAVCFLGFVADIRPVWQAADIAVVPSTEPESFGMVAIEAMAAGVPVVAAAHGGLLDIVNDGGTGLLFTPCSAAALADALQALIAQPALRLRLGAAGQLRQQQHFSAASQVIALEQIYRHMGAAR